MKGIVEIYSGDKLVYQDDNLVVDGAGQTIVDMLTVSPSLSGIPSASALLDTSNYTIQAISFGKGADQYTQYAHAFDSSATSNILLGVGANTKDAFLATCGTLPNPNTGESTYLPGVKFDGFTNTTNKGVVVLVTDQTTSSLFVSGGLPSAPSPVDTKLQEGIKVSDQGNAYYDIDTQTAHNGQNLNILPYINYESFSAVNIAGFGPGMPYGYGSFFGCYPEGSSTGGTDFYVISGTDVITSQYVYDFSANKNYYALSSNIAAYNTVIPTISEVLYSGTYKGLFNEASSMETRGYVGKVFDPLTSSVGLSGLGGAAVTSPLSGLVVSSVADSSTTGEVIYMITCGSGDLGTANLYGGIYQVGLHTIDVKNTTGNKPTGVAGVKQNYEAPFDFHPYNKPRRNYRLFSKHNLTKNLCYIEDDGTAAGALNYQDLKIVWRIKFL